jgi:fido (protein-threonine AMPylation protein)
MPGITTRCPEWEYDKVPGHERILFWRSIEILIKLRSGDPRRALIAAQDTRTLHRNLFDGLTPLGFDYYAGHYRGEDFLCLRECEVRIRNDPRVGHPAAVVPDQMRLMAAEVVNVAEHRDILYAVNSRVVGEAEKLACLIEVAAALFVYFLEIHPYANGNGHVGRFLLITLLCRYGIFPARWPLHPRPQDPPYSELISRYRSGDRKSLERYILSCL